MKPIYIFLLFLILLSSGCSPATINDANNETENQSTIEICPTPSPTPTGEPSDEAASTSEEGNDTTSSVNPEVVTLVPVEGPTLTAEELQQRENELLGVNPSESVEIGEGTPTGPDGGETDAFVTPTPCP